MSTDISGLTDAGRKIEEIPVPINYDIIRLFSEGLYKSPHKAIEELVSNAYDADARRVHVLLPEQIEEEEIHLAPLWVIDNGHGMDATGFRQLWRVAESSKIDTSPTGRAPIGQFGIGKLAAYVLAWKLTHLSRKGDTILLTTMDFRTVTGSQNEAISPVQVSLREIKESTAKKYLAEIEHRDPAAWALMFDDKKREPTWTAAALSDFKDLYHKLYTGRLRWILSTGLPLHSEFQISLNGERIASSKADLPEIKKLDFCEQLPGIGQISGTARIYERQLTTGKSEQLGRSNGFFIRVRGRVINLEDELFGIQQPNHASWSRFALEVDADGLREYLLSSREGVRDSEHIQEFRTYLLKIFNQCRAAFDERNKEQNKLDIVALLSDSPSIHVTEPLFRSVRSAMNTGSESFYIDIPRDVEEENRSQWLMDYENEVAKKPFDKTEFVDNGPNAPALRYDPATRSLLVNSAHPFVDKLTDGGKHRNPANLFASSEVLLEGQLQDQGIDRALVAGFLTDRDQILRLMAGVEPPTEGEVLRWLDVANQDSTALERATGEAFRMLGFVYEGKGENASGPDGILYARLGRHKTALADYKLVYDTKQTDQPAVSADKIDLASLEDFRKQNSADFGFFVANAYAAEEDADSAVNRRIKLETECYLTLLKVEHLRRLVWLHFYHGITLTELRSLFENARTVPEVNDWIKSLEDSLARQGEIPLRVLLEGLEAEKNDPKATPNIIAVRAKLSTLSDFEPERLIARLQAIERIIGSQWIEVDNSGKVVLHQTVEQILANLSRNIVGLAREGTEV